MRNEKRGTARRVTLAALGGAVVGATAWASRDIPRAMGGSPKGERAARVLASPQFRDGRFRNPTQTRSVASGSTGRTVRELLFGRHRRRPAGPVPLVTAPTAATTSGLHITWYGHSSTLVEMEGARVLLDPVWGDRASPSSLIGPRRMHEPPRPLDELPRLAAIVISHDHYDHLDLASVRVLERTQSAPFVVPLGVGAHLERWKIPSSRIIELDWDESTEVGGLRITAAAAQHFSGRGFARDDTLWASWVLERKGRRVFYTGDSGYFDGYAAIGERHGPFDATLVQIGAYDQAWPDIHMTPEEGVTAHQDVRGELLIPVHWGTFNLAVHDWTDPVDRVWAEAKARGVRLAVPRPGERVDVDAAPSVDGWWQALG
jgi:L-ascorbate metabolism protein UlaG (beta-lactamase superfamily)